MSLRAETEDLGVVAASGPVSYLLEELQFTFGEGPSLDAFNGRHPVLAPDLSSGSASRWPMFTRAAQEEGLGAVFAFPLQIGAARLGVLHLHRTEPGSLSAAALTQALSFADIATTALRVSQDATRQTSPHSLADGLDHRAELYQAQGMVMVQLGIGLKEAMVRLRAHSYASEQRLSDVAEAVVGRRLRLGRDRAPAAP